MLTLQPIRLELNTCTQVFPFSASCTSSSLVHWSNAQVTFHIECCEYQVLMQVNLYLLFIWFSFFSTSAGEWRWMEFNHRTGNGVLKIQQQHGLHLTCFLARKSLIPCESGAGAHWMWRSQAGRRFNLFLLYWNISEVNNIMEQGLDLWTHHRFFISRISVWSATLIDAPCFDPQLLSTSVAQCLSCLKMFVSFGNLGEPTLYHTLCVFRLHQWLMGYSLLLCGPLTTQGFLVEQNSFVPKVDHFCFSNKAVAKAG